MNVKERKYIVNLMVFSFSIFMLYAVIIPFNNAPDEQLRFDIVDFIRKYKELPIGGDPRLFYGDFGVTYAFKPYIAYVFSALLCILAELLKINIEPFMISRFFSVLCGVGTVYFTYLICKKIFKESKIKYVLPIFFASIPQFSFLNSYVNQDSLMIFLSSITVFLWIEGISNNWAWDIVIKISNETKNYVAGEGGALLINIDDKTLIESAEIVREKGTNRSNFYREQVDNILG